MTGRLAHAGSAAGDPVAAAHARLLRDTTLQFDFAAAPPPSKPPEWLNGLAPLFKALAAVMPYLFWGVLGLGLLAIVVFIARELLAVRWPGLKRKKRAPKPVAEWRPSEAEARALLEDADRLAAEGRYAEAAHLILFRSIEEIQGRRPHLLKPALTSRDIAGLDALPAQAREAFAGITALVERSFFGGRAVDAEGFGRCRAAYEAFAFPEAWR
jgi:hypothetical protein